MLFPISVKLRVSFYNVSWCFLSCCACAMTVIVPLQLLLLLQLQLFCSQYTGQLVLAASPQLSNGGFCLSKVFSAHVPLLMAVSEFWLRRICWGSLQLHYVHCSTLFVIVSAFIFVFLWWLWIRLSDLPMYVYVTVHCSGRLMMVLFCLSTGIQWMDWFSRQEKIADTRSVSSDAVMIWVYIYSILFITDFTLF